MIKGYLPRKLVTCFYVVRETNKVVLWETDGKNEFNFKEVLSCMSFHVSDKAASCKALNKSFKLLKLNAQNH